METVKTILLPALLGLTLTACSTNFPVQKFSMTLNVSGVPTATVLVTDTTTNTPVFNSPVTGSATISDLTEGHVFSIVPQAVAGYATPPAQSVTLKSNQSVQINYTAN